MTNASILSILVEVHYYAPAKVTGRGILWRPPSLTACLTCNCMLCNHQKIYAYSTFVIFDPTQPDPSKTGKSRPNARVDSTHEQLWRVLTLSLTLESQWGNPQAFTAGGLRHPSTTCKEHLMETSQRSGEIVRCIDFGILVWNCLFTPLLGSFWILVARFPHVTVRHPSSWPPKRTVLGRKHVSHSA